jgi:hypothetical protein
VIAGTMASQLDKVDVPNIIGGKIANAVVE